MSRNTLVKSVIDVSECRVRSAESTINICALRMAQSFEHRLRILFLAPIHCDACLGSIRRSPNQAIIRFTNSAGGARDISRSRSEAQPPEMPRQHARPEMAPDRDRSCCEFWSGVPAGTRTIFFDLSRWLRFAPPPANFRCPSGARNDFVEFASSISSVGNPWAPGTILRISA